MDTNGVEIGADAFKNHIAFSCWVCGHSVLACCSPDQRGSDEEHPVTCKDCKTAYFLDVRPHARKLYIHHV
jgi:transcription elongation factor Elf1